MSGEPASPVIPGPFVAQGRAIEARLRGTFPPTKFHFKVLPPKISSKNWDKIYQGNQPFIGLGFNGFRPDKSASKLLKGETSWMVLLAVRMAATTDKTRYYGDAQGLGALTMAAVAAPLLNGFIAETGNVLVTGVTNVVAEDWGDDCVITKVDLVVPTHLPLHDAIEAPEGLGWFGAQVNTWEWNTQDGSQGGYTSDWENDNEAC